MIFITGASGLLGASLIETLFAAHHGASDLQIRKGNSCAIFFYNL